MGRDAVGALRHGSGGIGVQHHQCIRRLIDGQTAVHADLHIAGVAAEIRHGLAGNAVLRSGIAGHLLLGRGGVQPAALGIDGLNDLRLALILEAAQLVEGAEHHTGGTAAAIAAVGAAENAGAVVYTAAPEHVAQCQ